MSKVKQVGRERVLKLQDGRRNDPGGRVVLL